MTFFYFEPPRSSVLEWHLPNYAHTFLFLPSPCSTKSISKSSSYLNLQFYCTDVWRTSTMQLTGILVPSTMAPFLLLWMQGCPIILHSSSSNYVHSWTACLQLCNPPPHHNRKQEIISLCVVLCVLSTISLVPPQVTTTLCCKMMIIQLSRWHTCNLYCATSILHDITSADDNLK